MVRFWLGLCGAQALRVQRYGAALQVEMALTLALTMTLALTLTLTLTLTI